MGFIFGVLIIGALLSLIFGKRVAAMFVTGTAAVIGILFGILLLLLSPLIWGFFTTPSRVESSSYSSPSQKSSTAYGSTASSGSTSSYAPPAPTYQTSSPYSPPPLPSSAVPTAAPGPRIGIDLADVPAYTVQQLTYLNVPAGAGTWISVQPNSPAANAGLKTYDVILSAGTQTQPADWITPSNLLPDYLDRVGYNVPVKLHIYRASERRDFWVWVYPR